jgi:predicted Zn-dependent peptidase
MYKHYQLGNGIRIITERIPHFQIGFYRAMVSSRVCIRNSPEENGLTHFIEHMLFKGTESRTARQIAEPMDSVGGQMNAFTAKEYSCFYCKVMDEHIELALEPIDPTCS